MCLVYALLYRRVECLILIPHSGFFYDPCCGAVVPFLTALNSYLQLSTRTTLFMMGDEDVATKAPESDAQVAQKPSMLSSEDTPAQAGASMGVRVILIYNLPYRTELIDFYRTIVRQTDRLVRQLSRPFRFTLLKPASATNGAQPTGVSAKCFFLTIQE